MESKEFRRFRSWLTRREFLQEDDEANKLLTMFNNNGLILFFKKDDAYYGAPEDSRVVFARLKNPDEETSDGWEDEATFTAINLNKLVHGEPSQLHVFDKDDIKDMKIVDQDDVLEALKNEKAEKPKPEFSALKIIKLKIEKERDKLGNLIRANEE